MVAYLIMLNETNIVWVYYKYFLLSGDVILGCLLTRVIGFKPDDHVAPYRDCHRVLEYGPSLHHTWYPASNPLTVCPLHLITVPT